MPLSPLVPLLVLCSPAAPPDPVQWAPLVHPGQVLLVSADDDDDDADEERPRPKKKAKRKASRDDNDDAGSPDLGSYLKDAASFQSRDLAEQASDGVVLQWVLGALFPSWGGHLWAPKVAYKDVPGGADLTPAYVMGTLGILLPFGHAALVPCAAACAAPGLLLIWLYGLGAVIFMVLFVFFNLLFQGTYGIFQLIMNWYVIPRVVSWNYSDAYAAEDTAPKKRSKKQRRRPVDDDDDDGDTE